MFKNFRFFWSWFFINVSKLPFWVKIFTMFNKNWGLKFYYEINIEIWAISSLKSQLVSKILTNFNSKSSVSCETKGVMLQLLKKRYIFKQNASSKVFFFSLFYNNLTDFYKLFYENLFMWECLVHLQYLNFFRYRYLMLYRY